MTNETTAARKRCSVLAKGYGFYIDSENGGIDWTFGTESEATRLSPKAAEHTAIILNRLGITAEVTTYEQ